MSDLWQQSRAASQRFATQALEYDHRRPRYPEPVFDDIMEIAGLSAGARAIEIGAGTGIATEPLVRRGLAVTAIEPAPEMVAVARAKLTDPVQVFVGRFEDYIREDPVQMIASFNAWHWVEPAVAVDRVADLLEPGGSLGLVWTEVVSWGQDPFEERLAEVFGSLWPKRFDHVDGSLQPIRLDGRFGEFRVRRHRFERRLDAKSFVAVTKTYGGHRTAEQYDGIERVINALGGWVDKVEEAVLYISRRQ